MVTRAVRPGLREGFASGKGWEEDRGADGGEEGLEMHLRLCVRCYRRRVGWCGKLHIEVLVLSTRCRCERNE